MIATSCGFAPTIWEASLCTDSSMVSLLRRRRERQRESKFPSWWKARVSYQGYWPVKWPWTPFSKKIFLNYYEVSLWTFVLVNISYAATHQDARWYIFLCSLVASQENSHTNKYYLCQLKYWNQRWSYNSQYKRTCINSRNKILLPHAMKFVSLIEMAGNFRI